MTKRMNNSSRDFDILTISKIETHLPNVYAMTYVLPSVVVWLSFPNALQRPNAFRIPIANSPSIVVTLGHTFIS